MTLNPEPNQHVKIYFRNGVVEEGIVLQWSDTKSVLRSLSSQNKLIIQNTLQDIIAIKIFAYDHLEERKKVYIDEELQLENSERDSQIRAAKLAELRILRGRAERERARELMNEFRLEDATTASFNMQSRYGLPRRLQKPPKFDPNKKD